MLLTSVRGPRFAVHDLGGEGPAVLICHATGFCGMAYARLAALLAADHHVWAIDFAGHGDSDPPADDDYAWHHLIEYAVAAARAISPQQPPAVVGHSMGAAVALQAATAHPGTFSAAYVYEPALVLTPSHTSDSGSTTDSSAGDNPVARPNPMVEGARRRQASFPSKAAALLRYASRRPLAALEAGSLAAYVEHGFAEQPDGTVALKCRPESEARTFQAGGAMAVSTLSAALPVLCVSGDPAEPLAAIVPPLAQALPDARLRVHHHLGHFGPLESPALIADEIRDFLRTVRNGEPVESAS